MTRRLSCQKRQKINVAMYGDKFKFWGNTAVPDRWPHSDQVSKLQTKASWDRDSLTQNYTSLHMVGYVNQGVAYKTAVAMVITKITMLKTTRTIPAHQLFLGE